ncbi:MAG: oxygenase MpaB family protein [Actinomycetota bacterium]|nr:oxygenase MpaB family protein [Actinomycetota bacterium]
MTEQARDGYPDATGLLERSAAAFVGGVPEDGPDNGFFGPASVTWRTAADASTPVAGLRALMIQALHPLAMAGVEQHSQWRQDPVGRLAATSGYLATVSFGSRADAERVAARVRRIHEHVTGVDEVTGRRYAASDPALLLWVHAALVDSTLVARELFGVPLTGALADDYVAEMVTAAELVGIPRDQVPATAAGLAGYLDSVRPVLVASPAARESVGYLLDPPGLDADLAAIWQDIRAGVIGSLPDWARAMYGLPDEPLTPDRRTEISQALGVLDAVFLGQPGVLEARQRIAVRVRAARRA